MGHTVMVVDDSAMIRMIVKRTLRDAGFDVVEAADGEDAWGKLRSGALPAVMVCDVNMPRMNGLELLEQIQSSDTLRGLPVVMLTTEGQPEVIRRARRLGANGWLLKPVQPHLLLAAVQRLAKGSV